MMQQYMQMKEQYPDTLLFFRLGDFYEMFFEDALTASRELELTLTARDCGLAERAPMCGVPFHSVQTYLGRLLEKGYRVAICEQMQDPSQAKGLVDREVVRVVTPGTIIEPAMLDERANSYLLSVCLDEDEAGLAYVDVSTGEFFAYELPNARRALGDELARIAPKEMLLNEGAVLAGVGQGDRGATISPYAALSQAKARQILLDHFGLQSLDPFGLEEHRLAVCAAGALMRYLGDTQRNALQHITGIRLYQSAAYMLLDSAARRNLELTIPLRGKGKRGTLLGLLDHTATAMGGRLLRAWIEQPLASRQAIEERLDAVAAIHGEHVLMQSLHEELRGVYDIERLLSKLAYKNINPRDCLALCASLRRVPAIRGILGGLPGTLLRGLCAQMDDLPDLTDLLTRAIHPDAPALVSDGSIIRDGYDKELDGYRQASTQGKQWLADLETQEREATGIKNLRIQYNRVFGYYIEVTKSYYDQVPYRYQRKQTLANAERFTTKDLIEIERKLLGAQDKALRLEQMLFLDIRQQIGAQLRRLQATAHAVKAVDALASLALAAARHGYTRPEITEDGALHIQNGRHPVVEAALTGGAQFVPNDTDMDERENRMLIITGPNMAGKSTYMRQVALIALMAHLGSFVPARSASVCLIDRIFTRVGASDDLASGQSTFMVEMNEMAHILLNATPKSLVILDEIGRGTSTFDGLSIAWAVVEYLCGQDVQAKTLFATHYHELSELEGRLPGVANFRVAAKEHGEDIIFLRKIVRGGADKSFGIHVARLAGMPQAVLLRAQEILARLEAADVNQSAIGQNILEEGRREKSEQVTLFTSPATALIEELRDTDVMAMTPMEAMNLLFALRERARRM
jgi:DNA mismatch repair protein MutS